LKAGWQTLQRVLLGGGLWLIVGWQGSPVARAGSLDEFLSCLETNGVLVDRERAVRGGIRGILQSIDPAVVISYAKPSLMESMTGAPPVSVVQAVELWSENLAYLKVSGLEPGSGEEIMAHLKSLSTRWGVLLDLRGARGEDLDSVSLLASLARGKNEPLFFIIDNRGIVLATNTVTGCFARIPLLMLLIDQETCGASEALALVLKGRAGVLLLGAVTRGDPYLRTGLPLPDGRMAKIATQKWVPVSGKTCENIGVSPDIMVEAATSSGNDSLSRTNNHDRALSLKSDADRDLMMRVEGDAVLQRATDILLGLQAVGGYGRE